MKPKPWLFSAALAAAALCALFPARASAKDFPEAVLAADPLAAAQLRGFPAGLGGAFEYGNYLIAHDDVDSFFLRASLSPVFFTVGDGFALGALYETDLLCGPVGAGQTAANVAAFWMNAVQFEYGLYASAALPGAAGLHALAEYSRTSQHPLHSGNSYTYSQVTADILMLGLSLPEFELGPVSARAYLRLGYRNLMPFWQSTLPQPRVSWVAKPAIEARLPLRGKLSLVARSHPEIFIDRFADKLDANFFGEAGVAFADGATDDELVLSLYATHDSDMLDGAAHPTFEAGLVFRFAVSRL
jgi:hypothetical protein